MAIEIPMVMPVAIRANRKIFSFLIFEKHDIRLTGGKLNIITNYVLERKEEKEDGGS